MAVSSVVRKHQNNKACNEHARYHDETEYTVSGARFLERLCGFLRQFDANRRGGEKQEQCRR